MFHPCLRFYSLKPQLRPDGQSPTATRAGEKLHLESGEKADKTARVLDQVLRWQDLAVIRKGLQNLYAWVRFPPAPPTFPCTATRPEKSPEEADATTRPFLSANPLSGTRRHMQEHGICLLCYTVSFCACFGPLPCDCDLAI